MQNDKDKSLGDVCDYLSAIEEKVTGDSLEMKVGKKLDRIEYLLDCIRWGVFGYILVSIGIPFIVYSYL